MEQSWKVGLFVPILQMRKLRLRGEVTHARSHSQGRGGAGTRTQRQQPLLLHPHHTVLGTALVFMPAPGQETDGPKAVGVKAGVAKGQSSVTYQQCDQGKSPDLSRSQVPQSNLRIIIVRTSLRVVRIMK